MTKTQTVNELKLSYEQQIQIQKELGNLLKQNGSLKKALQQKEEEFTSEKEQLFLELLEVFDAMESLLNYLEENPDPNPQFIKRLPKSLGTVQKKMLATLERRLVNLIVLQESKPDFSFCQVVDREERNDLEEQTITKIVRQGFRLGDKVLRPMEVITAKKNI
jgi:molecular chaperone GrpE